VPASLRPAKPPLRTSPHLREASRGLGSFKTAPGGVAYPRKTHNQPRMLSGSTKGSYEKTFIYYGVLRGMSRARSASASAFRWNFNGYQTVTRYRAKQIFRRLIESLDMGPHQKSGGDRAHSARNPGQPIDRCGCEVFFGRFGRHDERRHYQPTIR